MLGTVPVLKACKHPNICEGAEGNSMFILSVGMAEARAPVGGFRDETCKALFKIQPAQGIWELSPLRFSIFHRRKHERSCLWKKFE